MNKHILNAFLLGTIILSCNGFTSCNDDVDELKSRMSVVEIAIDDIKSQLQNALVTGASITKVEQKDDRYQCSYNNRWSRIYPSFRSICKFIGICP